MLRFFVCDEYEVIFQFQLLCMAFIDKMNELFSYNGEWVDVINFCYCLKIFITKVLEYKANLIVHATVPFLVMSLCSRHFLFCSNMAKLQCVILAASDSTSIQMYDTLTSCCNSCQAYIPYTSAMQAL